MGPFPDEDGLVAGLLQKLPGQVRATSRKALAAVKQRGSVNSQMASLRAWRGVVSANATVQAANAANVYKKASWR